MLGLLVFAVSAIFVLAVFGAMLRVLIAVLRVVGAICLAGAVGAAAGFFVAALGTEPEYAVAAGLLVAVLASLALFQRGKSRRLPDIAARAVTPADMVVSQAEIYSGAIEPGTEHKVSNAWKQLATMVPAADVHRLNRARDACARLMAASEAHPLALELMEFAVLFRRNLPELALRNATLWNDADEAERADLSAGILADVALAKKRAEAQLSIHRSNRRDDLHALRNHLAARMDEGV